jgi:hypothetical protein
VRDLRDVGMRGCGDVRDVGMRGMWAEALKCAVKLELVPTSGLYFREKTKRIQMFIIRLQEFSV